MKIEIHEWAQKDLADGVIYQEQQKGLGLEFLDEVVRTFKLLQSYPNLGSVWRRHYRYPVRRFPYQVIYQVSKENLYVIALAHQRRRFGFWLCRVETDS